MVWLTSVHSASTAARPRKGRTKRATNPCDMVGLLRHGVDGEALRVVLGLGGIEDDAVEERLLLHVLPRGLDAHLLGHFSIDVGTVHAVHDALVVRRLLDHAPAPELREPPHSMR